MNKITRTQFSTNSFIFSTFVPAFINNIIDRTYLSNPFFIIFIDGQENLKEKKYY